MKKSMSTEREEDVIKFLAACSKLNHGSIRRLIERRGVKASEAEDKIGQNAIHFVSMSAANDMERQASLIGYLVQQGADVNKQRTTDKWTPLFLAVSFGLTQVVHALLQAGAKTDIRDDEGKSPEDIADKYRMHYVKDILVHR